MIFSIYSLSYEEICLFTRTLMFTELSFNGYQITQPVWNYVCIISPITPPVLTSFNILNARDTMKKRPAHYMHFIVHYLSFDSWLCAGTNRNLVFFGLINVVSTSHQSFNSNFYIFMTFSFCNNMSLVFFLFFTMEIYCINFYIFMFLEVHYLPIAWYPLRVNIVVGRTTIKCSFNAPQNLTI